MDPWDEMYGDDPEFEEDEEGVSLGTVLVKRETEKAILIMDREMTDRWIPKSVIHPNSEVYNDAHSGHELIVKSWWAEKEGLDI
jgi:hypothetical protein